MKKKTILPLFILAFFFGQNLFAQKIGIECKTKSNGECECQVQNYTNIKANLKANKPDADLRVFWDFGDGTYAADQPGGKLMPHRYKSPKNYTVTAHFIVQYASLKFPPATCIATAKTSNGVSESVSDFSLTSSLKEVNRIRPEDFFVVVLSMPDKGSVKLDFDKTVFAFNGQPHGTEGVKLEGNTIQSKGKQNIFIPMRSLKFNADGNLAKIKAQWNGQTSNELSLEKKSAYDPNDLKANIRKLKWSDVRNKADVQVTYTLRFENEGEEEPARHVLMKVKIPPGMTYKEQGINSFRIGELSPANAPYNIRNLDCPFCKGGDSSKNDRCLRVIAPKQVGDSLIFEFQNIELKPKTSTNANKGSVEYVLYLNPKIEKKTLTSSADIIFDENGHVTPTNNVSVHFKPEPRLSLRVGRTMNLPFKKDDKANYELGLSVSRLRPYGFYFPTEVSISVLPEELKSGNMTIKGLPVRLTQQIRHNFFGDFFGFGAGLSANISINKKTESQNISEAVSFTKLLAFVDLNINALKQKPNLGVRLGYPLTQKFQPVNGSKGVFQIYAAYQF